MDILQLFGVPVLNSVDDAQDLEVYENDFSKINIFYSINQNTGRSFLIEVKVETLKNENAIKNLIEVYSLNQPSMLKLKNIKIKNKDTVYFCFEFTDILLYKYISNVNPSIRVRLDLMRQFINYLIHFHNNKFLLDYIDINYIFIENFDDPVLKILHNGGLLSRNESLNTETIFLTRHEFFWIVFGYCIIFSKNENASINLTNSTNNFLEQLEEVPKNLLQNLLNYSMNKIKSLDSNDFTLANFVDTFKQILEYYQLDTIKQAILNTPENNEIIDNYIQRRDIFNVNRSRGVGSLFNVIHTAPLTKDSGSESKFNSSNNLNNMGRVNLTNGNIQFTNNTVNIINNGSLMQNFVNFDMKNEGPGGVRNVGSAANVKVNQGANAETVDQNLNEGKKSNENEKNLNEISKNIKKDNKNNNSKNIQGGGNQNSSEGENISNINNAFNPNNLSNLNPNLNQFNIFGGNNYYDNLIYKLYLINGLNGVNKLNQPSPFTSPFINQNVLNPFNNISHLGSQLGPTPPNNLLNILNLSSALGISPSNLLNNDLMRLSQLQGYNNLGNIGNLGSLINNNNNLFPFLNTLNNFSTPTNNLASILMRNMNITNNLNLNNLNNPLNNLGGQSINNNQSNINNSTNNLNNNANSNRMLNINIPLNIPNSKVNNEVSSESDTLNDMINKKRNRNENLISNIKNSGSGFAPSVSNSTGNNFPNKRTHKKTSNLRKKNKIDSSEDEESSISEEEDLVENPNYLENLKKTSLKIELELFEQHYEKEMNKLCEDFKHIFMKKHFPEMYNLENFYLHIKLVSDKRKNNYRQFFAAEIKNEKEKENKEKKHPENNQENNQENNKENNQENEQDNLANKDNITNYAKLTMKKLWSLKAEKEKLVQEFINNMEKNWPFDLYPWSQEAALEFLMQNDYDQTGTVKLITLKDKSFNDFITEKISKIYPDGVYQFKGRTSRRSKANSSI